MNERLTIAAIRQGLREKTFSAAELTKVFLERSRRLQPTLNAFLHLSETAEEEAALRDAQETLAGDVRALEGVPIAVKDTILAAGMPATAASKMLEGYLPPYSATAVVRVQAAGGIVTGKTNCDEFAMGTSGEQSAFGPTKNPWDVARVPGGSSSGSAAAVAAGLAVAALGSDTGGSVRQPAAFCGVVGMKPTYGRVSRYGLISLASSLDTIGPIAANVADTLSLFNVIAGRDERDATSMDAPPLPDALDTSTLAGMRIGLPKEYFASGLSGDVAEHVQAAAKRLAALGAEVREVSLPHTEDALAAYYIILPAEASSNLARYDGVRYGRRAGAGDLLATYLRSREGFGAEPKRRIMIGTYVLSSGYADAFYKKAQQVRTLIVQDFRRVFEEVDAVFCPTTPTLPFGLGEKAADPLALYLADVYTVPANIAGLPALSLPVAWERGLPVGGQLMAPQWEDGRVFRIAAALEAALGLPQELPDIAKKT